jgi:hypothetical protein
MRWAPALKNLARVRPRPSFSTRSKGRGPLASTLNGGLMYAPGLISVVEPEALSCPCVGSSLCPLLGVWGWGVVRDFESSQRYLQVVPGDFEGVPLLN